MSNNSGVLSSRKRRLYKLPLEPLACGARCLCRDVVGFYPCRYLFVNEDLFFFTGLYENSHQIPLPLEFELCLKLYSSCFLEITPCLFLLLLCTRSSCFVCHCSVSSLVHTSHSLPPPPPRLLCTVTAKKNFFFCCCAPLLPTNVLSDYARFAGNI